VRDFTGVSGYFIDHPCREVYTLNRVSADGGQDHPDEYRTWLDRNLTDPAGLSRLFQPYPADLMEIQPVSQLVNSPKNDMARLIDRIEDVPNTPEGKGCCGPGEDAFRNDR
jgi:hypothetical protein